MSSHDSIEDQLLAYHMGWLDRAQMQDIERLVDSAAEIAARSRELREQLEPLSQWTALPAVENMESQILRRIQRENPPATKLDPEPPYLFGVLRWPFSLTEVITGALCVVLMGSLLVPGLLRASDVAKRHACQTNLRTLATGLAAYGQDFELHLPLAAPVGPAAGLAAANMVPSSWLGERSAGVRRLRNSRNRFLLLAGGYIRQGTVFTCPADSRAIAMRFDDPQAFDDFPESRNCSYDSQIMTRRNLRLRSHPEMVVYADSNPIFDSGAADSSAEMNSRLHEQLGGQNIMRLDGSVAWARSPFVGIENDNIWQIGKRANYTGREVPELATDSFLIP